MTSIHVRGEGGQVIEMDLPLPDAIQDRLTKGLIRRVNADGSPYTGSAPHPTVTAQTEGQTGGSALTEGRTPRPAVNARKAEWVGWAVGVHGMDPEDADAMSKADLMELPELPQQPVVADHPSTQTPDPPATARTDGRPDEDADKSEWIAYVVSQGQLSAEDAANLTRDDLIDLAK
ncbi:hypothetical protein [Streptomyces sp. WAC 01529]|uniref:hypothetical protein n=1 Tax=Streptomyces sp. WAC 01529 TaxID=2203205 RepID=UPI0019D1051B|nr:hypothetical protein [Streptomyces sp. WAC 01529]